MTTDPRDLMQAQTVAAAQKGKGASKTATAPAPHTAPPGKLAGEGVSDAGELAKLVALIKASEAESGAEQRNIVIGEFSVLASRTPESFIEQLQGLTRTEAAVTRMLGWGRANSDIAMLLDCSEATVRTHMNNVIGKLELDGMRELITIAGLLFHPLD